MTNSIVRLSLILLYVAAVWVRVGTSNELPYPYYNGESATNFRNASLIAERGHLPALDDKTSWPDGYSPAQSGPNGYEYLTGFVSRIVSVFSDMTHKEISGRLTILLFSLCVFTFYSLSRQLWSSRIAGVFAAFLVGLISPLVIVTMGREYLHAPIAILLISFHLSVLLTCVGKASPMRLILLGATALSLAAVWRLADFYYVFVAIFTLVARTHDGHSRRRIMIAHALAMFLAGVTLPHLRAEQFLINWPAILVLVTTIYLFARDWLPKKIPAWAWVTVGTIVLTIVSRPVATDGVAVVSDLDYWLYRIRFPFGKPIDPAALSDGARYLWTQARANPPPLMLLGFLLPFALLVHPTVSSLRDIKREGRTRIWPSILLAAVGIGFFLVDRSAIFAAALGVIPLVSVAVVGLTRRLKTRALPIGATVMIVFLQAVVPFGKANPTHMLASAFRVSTQQNDGFLWISIGNADLELVRYMATRTSVRDAIFSPPRISSLLVVFAGRTTVITPGVYTLDTMERTSNSMVKFYDHEDELYSLCEANDIQYVLYSIDLLLDTSSYSTRYAVGRTGIDNESLVYKMHFSPENLKHFNLVYQNDNYRLFRVTREMEPVFLTDHPPVFQEALLERHGGSIDSFYASVVDALLAYQLAINAQSQGDDQEAIRRFRYCLEITPRFTNGWLGVGDSLFRMGNVEAANAAYSRALETAPDNPNALFNTALTMAQLGRVREAYGLLDVLISSSRERAMVERAQELKAALERDFPKETGAEQ